MPTPPRTSLGEIVTAGAAVLEEEGPPGLTMQAVAHRVGVRAPSLYRHVDGRDALIRLVAEAAVTTLAGRIDAAVPVDAPPQEALRGVAHALRAFGRERPAAFRLVFSPGAEATRPRPEVSARAVATVLRVAGELAGTDRALEAARTVTAWASGFVAMELADGFRMGGDVDAAFEYGIARLAEALSCDGVDGD